MTTAKGDTSFQSERHQLPRILDQLASQQQQSVLQFTQINSALESIRAEIRRTDELHHKEVDALQKIIGTLLAQKSIQPEQQTITPSPQQIYYASASPATFFNDTHQTASDMKQNKMPVLQPVMAPESTALANCAPTDLYTKFVKKDGEWDCEGCFTRQPVNVEKCACCGKNKDRSTGEKDVFAKPVNTGSVAAGSKFQFGLTTPEKPKGSSLLAAIKEETPQTPSLFGCNSAAAPSEDVSGESTTKDVKKNEEPALQPNVAPEAAVLPKPFNTKFLKKDGEWDCQGCYTRLSADIETCPCCERNKDGLKVEKDISTKPANTGAAPADKFQFGLTTSDKLKLTFLAAASVAAKEEIATPQKPSLFGSSTTPVGGVFGGATKLDSEALIVKPTFSFGIKKEDALSTAPSPAAVSGANQANFSFKPPNKVFGANFAASGLEKNNGGSIFDPDAMKLAELEISKQKTSKFGASVCKKEGDESDGEAEDNYEPDVDFKPVIPLPDLIEVTTGEENEEALFKERAKLYRYSAETKEWKERGVGELKILKNLESNTYRVVMRREQTHKICANFKLVSGITVSKMPKNMRACRWICNDFSDGILSTEQLSAKFASPEAADSFIKLFHECLFL